MTLDAFFRKYRYAINLYTAPMMRADLEQMLFDAEQVGRTPVGPADHVTLRKPASRKSEPTEIRDF